MDKPITIAYFNFWVDPDNDNFFTKFVEHNIAPVKLVEPVSNPDILICSVFGHIAPIFQLKAKMKIFFSGENLIRYPQYNNIELLKEYDVDSKVKIHLHFGSGLNEKLRVVGTWNSEYEYTMDCTNYWSRGNLVTNYHSVQDLIDLLSEKNVNEMSDKDFTDIELEETLNGNLELDELIWDKPKPTKKVLDEDGFDYHDLYDTGEITDSDYEFVGPDSLFVELRNDRDTLHIGIEGEYKFTKGPRVKRWTKKNQQDFQYEYMTHVNELAKLHEKYELIIEERLTENLPNVSDGDIKELRFQFDGVKAEIDSVYKSWHDELLEITITNEVGA